MNKGIQTIQAFDNKYYKFGDAFQLTSKSSGKTENAILLYCENDRLIFSVVGYSDYSSIKEAKNLYFKIRDLETTEIRRLIPEEE